MRYNKHYEKMIETHLADKIEAARRLSEFAKSLKDEEMRIEIAEIIALLTRTVKEMW